MRSGGRELAGLGKFVRADAAPNEAAMSQALRDGARKVHH